MHSPDSDIAAVDLDNKAALSDAIKHQAYSEGFDKVGIVKAEPLFDEGRRLEEWLARGYEASMKWMLREPAKRSNPLEFFPEAKSIIVVAANYYTPHEHEDGSATGKISRYAWGDDYHDVIGEKLHSLLSWIESIGPGVKGKVCVDIQPVMDKAWAVRAGLGWLGKHTNVITPEFGSWVFIGELLLNIELEFDSERIDDHCGTCTLCIDACPTDAITEPYVLDSDKCISYATIELRSDSLPVEIESKLSGWLYGCDICQDVCPWNRFQQVSDEHRFDPRPGNVNADLAGILELEPSDYARRYRGSAMKRAKLTGLQRNANALRAHGAPETLGSGNP
ncbi:MAG TPA: tRNA epoxyqueuosine(34) reductase QueG [Pyrinomonadaceae bacterium]